LGQVVEKAIDFFGGRIVQCWCNWFRGQPTEARHAAVAELASMSPGEARLEAKAVLSRLAPEARPEDLAFALEYLSAIPGTVDRALLRDPATGAAALPPTVTFDEPHLLLQLLPTDIPPYTTPTELPGSQYVLEQLLGSGGFGAVYRATTPSLQHLPFAIKFCLDPNLTAALHRERSNLERLMRVGGENWSPRVVRLYGYDLEHRTPYLVYEFVPGGDLTHHLDVLRQRKGRALNADEVLDLMLQVVEGLAFAHRHGLVHRDLKPANVLVDGDKLKLADFGLGGVSAVRAAQVSRIGSTTLDFLTIAERASLFRGAGTPLYMSPEQRRGAPPDPRQDLYSLGVMWFQLLAGDVTRELHPGWAKELAVKHRVQQAHLDLIGHCVGWVEERPHDAAELLPLMQALKSPPPPTAIPVAQVSEPSPPPPPPEDLRESLRTSLVKQLHEGQKEAAWRGRNWGVPISLTIGTAIPLVALTFAIVENRGGFVLGLILAAGMGYFYFWLHSRRRQEAEARVESALRTLSEEFPEHVRQWGGLTVLRTPATVEEVLRRLPGGTPPEPVPPPPVPAERKEALVEKLTELRQVQIHEARFGQRRSLPWWLALILSAVLIGSPLGVAAGLLFEKDEQPIEIGRNRREPPRYYDHWGNHLSDAQYYLAERHLPGEAAMVGLGAGLAATFVGTFLLSWFRWYRLPLFLCAMLGGVLGTLAGLGFGNLYHNTYSPWSHFDNNRQLVYYDYRGDTLTEERNVLEERHADVGGWLTGIGSGIALGLLVVLVVQWRWGRVRARARQAVSNSLRELAAAFPDVVRAWGQQPPEPRLVEEALVRAGG
jgi:serine/threonine protein kinase